MEVKGIEIPVPEGANVILGQTHFIKTVEDIYETIVNTNPDMKFGIGFCEASGPCLVRYEGNDEEMIRLAQESALKVGAGHFFIIYLREGYPINILPRLRTVPEVCTIFCATANPVTVLYVDDERGRGIVGVIDGFRARGIEGREDRRSRKEFLRKIGYKF